MRRVEMMRNDAGPAESPAHHFAQRAKNINMVGDAHVGVYGDCNAPWRHIGHDDNGGHDGGHDDNSNEEMFRIFVILDCIVLFRLLIVVTMGIVILRANQKTHRTCKFGATLCDNITRIIIIVIIIVIIIIMNVIIVISKSPRLKIQSLLMGMNIEICKDILLIFNFNIEICKDAFSYILPKSSVSQISSWTSFM